MGHSQPYTSVKITPILQRYFCKDNTYFTKIINIKGARNPGKGGEGLNTQEPLPNHLIKQQQEVDKVLY